MRINDFLLKFVTTVVLVFSFQVFAEKQSSASLPSDFMRANWAFSGLVASDSGDEYGYHFLIQKQDNHFQVTTSIIDAQSQEVLIFYKSEAEIKHPEELKWKVGRAFLSFNPINESWIFGLKEKEQMGFNFKVDLLMNHHTGRGVKDLSKGLKLMVNQTGRINGHIQLGKDKKEQFVTSSSSWFRQIWFIDTSLKPQPLSSLFCHFNDGGGLYAFSLKSEDAREGALAGFCDAKGNPSSLSQFIEVQETLSNQHWVIRVPSPQMQFKLTDSLIDPNIMAGFIAEGAKTGFCVFCKDAFEPSKQS
tara:strand:+ start:600 stop:1511 length:912 start_codon:yes stop_codon:yes gene_type:complete